ncbi:MAG: glycosyltransferase family 2 protein [Candidatus Babeliaceae bacterium]
MKKNFIYTLFLLPLLYCSIIRSADKNFVVIIPTYNNQNRCIANLMSVLGQLYNNYRVIIIDDASTDGTGDILEQFISYYQLHDKVILIRNQSRQGALANIYKAAHMCDPYEIIVDLDGDDWLAYDGVLSYLNNVYQDESVWMTYGQFLQYPLGHKGWCRQLPQEIIENNAYREYLWITSALRTFYAKLFQLIKKEDLQYHNTFFPITSDLAFMFPMLEMAGNHSKFIKKVLYIYDRNTGSNDEHMNKELQETIELHIRRSKRYAPLKKL